MTFEQITADGLPNPIIQARIKTKDVNKGKRNAQVAMGMVAAANNVTGAAPTPQGSGAASSSRAPRGKRMRR